MLNVFGKDYARNFRMILFCCHLHHRLHNEANDNYNLLNHILLIFRYYIYILREKRILNIDILIANLIKVKKKEKQTSIATINKRKASKKNWCVTDNILPVT